MINSFTNAVNTFNTSKPIGPLPSSPNWKGKIGIDGPGEKTSFGEMFKGFMGDVNHLQNNAGQSIQKMIAGEIKDPHQVMLAVGEAKMALNLLIEIRNKVLEAYNDVIHMRA